LAIALVAPRAALGRDGVVESVELLDVTTDYTWGYKSGLKQPLGAYMNGLSIHQISKSSDPHSFGANPDYILWADETASMAGVSLSPVGAFDGDVANPGGSVSFDRLGWVWYGYGARVQSLPFSLFRSTGRFRIDRFRPILEDFVTGPTGSTAPNFLAANPRILIAWRHDNSNSRSVTVRFARYDMHGDFSAPDFVLDVGKGERESPLGKIGIEQLWLKYDPRFRYAMLTWQWFDVTTKHFGSNPFLFSRDRGAVWRTADGKRALDLPIGFNDRTEVLVPDDHVGNRDNAGWHYGDLGISPHGVFWMTQPAGDQSVDGEWRARVWRFVDGEWSGQDLSGLMAAKAKPYACGVTRDYMVFAYAELSSPHVLRARISADDGATWSEPIVLDDLVESTTAVETRINWVSFAQPSWSYDSNDARFFYGHYRPQDGPNAKNYKNKIKWVRVRLAEPIVPESDDRRLHIGVRPEP
jgi:hypothetical protein